MTDPLTIVSTVSSVASIVELLGKTVSALHALHSRWKEADFTLINLVGQLTALKTALSKLQEWMDTDIGEQHHQLVMDIDDSVACCSTLVRRMDSEVEELRQDSKVGLGAQNKIKLLLKNGTLEELQKMVDRQTSALTLLLTVCNCKAMSEQKIILEKTTSRKIFKRVKDDTSSLYVQRSSTSVYTYCTDNLSKISKVFEFDHELFTSKVYERAIRGFLKDNVKNTHLQRQRSKLTTLRFEINAKIPRTELNTLLLGDSDCAQAFIKCIRTAHPDCFTSEEREKYCKIIHNKIIRLMESITRIQRYMDIDLDDAAKMHIAVLYLELKKIQTSDGKITIESANAIQGLWEDKKFAKWFLDNKTHLPDLCSYLIKEIQRIAQNNYLPTDADIFKIRSGTLATLEIQEYRFASGSRPLRIFDGTSQQPIIKTGISQSKDCVLEFAGITSIIICVDLRKYDEILPSKQIRIMESLRLFDLIINSPYYSFTPITVLFCNVKHFKGNLESKPLSDYFSDYTGGNDFNRVSEYLLRRFHEVDQRDFPTRSRFCESLDIFDIWFAVEEARDNFAWHVLREQGII